VEPVYMAENKYSYLVGSYRRATTDSYQAQSPENSFEDTVQSLFLQGAGAPAARGVQPRTERVPRADVAHPAHGASADADRP
jgi:hypothetical protein